MGLSLGTARPTRGREPRNKRRPTEPLNEQVTAAQVQRFGRLMMMSSVAMVLFAGAAWLHGDLKNIRTDWGV